MDKRFDRIRLHASLLWEYFLQYLKVRVSYRGDFLISVATSLAASLFALGFVLILIQQVHALAGWTVPEIIFLYGFAMVPYGLFNILSLNLYEFGNTYIMEGKFDRILLRPVSSLFQILFENFRIESFHEAAVGVLIVVWMGMTLHLHWTITDTLLFILFAVCGGAIYVSFFLLLSTFSFWFEDRIGIHPPFWNLIAFGRWPLSIYSGAVQFFLSWIVPFGFATFYPAARLLNHYEFHRFALIVPLISLACMTITAFAWRLGVRHYSSTGS